MRPRTLKNLGRVSLSVLLHADEAPSTIREVIDERRGQMRAVLREKLSSRVSSDDQDPDDEEG
jgi:hypothetical protein